MEGPLLFHFTPKVRPDESGNYCERLRLPKPTFKTKRRGNHPKHPCIVRDSALGQCPTSYGKKTLLCLQDVCFKVLDRPPQSSDLATSHCYLYRPLKKSCERIVTALVKRSQKRCKIFCVLEFTTTYCVGKEFNWSFPSTRTQMTDSNGLSTIADTIGVQQT